MNKIATCFLARLFPNFKREVCFQGAKVELGFPPLPPLTPFITTPTIYPFH
jgi:hypothetical protein